MDPEPEPMCDVEGDEVVFVFKDGALPDEAMRAVGKCEYGRYHRHN